MSSRKPREQASQLDRYLPYLFERWEDGCHNIACLFRELVEQGYKGSYASVRDNLVRLLPTPGRKNEASPLSKAPALATSRQAAFLFLRRPEKLRVEEQETVAKLRQINPEVDRAYDLVQQFAHMLRTRTGEHLDGWLDQVEHSELPELQSFAAGVKKDQDAVRAGLTWWGSQRHGGGTRDEAETDQKTRVWSGKLSSPAQTRPSCTVERTSPLPNQDDPVCSGTISHALCLSERAVGTLLGSPESRGGCLFLLRQNSLDPPTCTSRDL